LQLFFYSLFLAFYKTGIRIAGIWNKKARNWIKGREDIFDKIRKSVPEYAQVAWFHCASLGEFEQGRPVIESFRKTYPSCKIILTFFSPSGYEVRKNYPGADHVFYLPSDSPKNAERFLDIIRPSIAVFVKYDYWYYYLSGCKSRNIPLFIISALFRRNQPFFKWYGSLHRRMLGFFTALFVQDEPSRQLLGNIGFGHAVFVAGDTRFDRVSAIAGNFEPVKEIEDFCRDQKVLVAGSTWPADEKVIAAAFRERQDLTLIIAPHEVHASHIGQLKALFPTALLFSQLKGEKVAVSSQVLIIDNIGMLSRLYHYATLTYVGGGFGSGIHNILEAAVYHKPVFFGPNHYRFREALELKAAGGAFEINSDVTLKQKLTELFSDEQRLQSASAAAGNYVAGGMGATKKIMDYIQENRLLTS